MESNLLNEFLDNPLVLPKSKLEAFLAPYLGLRPASQVTIPAELPKGVEMGQRIDEEVKPHLMKLQSVTDMQARALRVQVLKKMLEQQFEAIVEDSDAYKAYYRWAEELGLRNNQIKVRPTVHELYLFKEKGTGGRIRKLMNNREKIRRKTQRRPGADVDPIRFAYPEEYDEKWLLRNGEVLGYPDCCVKSYARDRVNGVNVEARAARQLIDTLKETEVDTHVYFTGFFFPCSPQCENALSKGHQWADAFSELDPRLSELFERVLLMNTELVLRQPELISKYMSQFKKGN
ncbi:MAG: DUF483 domain-containing protein [Candidatus Bathyarchaeota archaeon]